MNAADVFKAIELGAHIASAIASGCLRSSVTERLLRWVYW